MNDFERLSSNYQSSLQKIEFKTTIEEVNKRPIQAFTLYFCTVPYQYRYSQWTDFKAVFIVAV